MNRLFKIIALSSIIFSVLSCTQETEDNNAVQLMALSRSAERTEDTQQNKIPDFGKFTGEDWENYCTNRGKFQIFKITSTSQCFWSIYDKNNNVMFGKWHTNVEFYDMFNTAISSKGIYEFRLYNSYEEDTYTSIDIDIIYHSLIIEIDNLNSKITISSKDESLEKKVYSY